MVGSRRNGRVFLGGMVLLLTVAACGSDGDRLSEGEFFAQANEICRVGNVALNETMEETFDALFPAGTEPTDEEYQQVIKENAQAIVDDIVSSVRGQIADIRDLRAPSDLEVQLGYVFDEGSEVLDQMSNVSAYELLVGDYDPFTRLNSELMAIGMTECGG
jgi:hypothetical protein